MARLLMLLGAMLGMMAVAVQGQDVEQIFKKYAKFKILSSCIGEEVVVRWMKAMVGASEKCSGRPMTINLDYYNNPPQTQGGWPVNIFGSQQPQQQTPYQQYPNYQYQQGNQYAQPGSQYPQQDSQYPQQGTPQYVQGYQYPQQRYQYQQPGYQYPQTQQAPTHQVGKREAKPFTPEILQDFKQKIASKIGNMTCVLREMQLLDSENMPNYKYFAQIVRDLRVNDDLKSDLVEAQDFCREFSMCVPVHKLKDPMAKELGYAFTFMKCLGMKKLKACMKQDFLRYHQNLNINSQGFFGQTGGMQSNGSDPEDLISQLFIAVSGDSFGI